MVPMDAIIPFFDELKVSKLLRFRFTGITDDDPMWFFHKDEIENSSILQKSIREFVKRCEKLESFTLRLFLFMEFLPDIDAEFKFPTPLREINFDLFFWRPISEVNRPVSPFLLKLLEDCRGNLEKLRIGCRKFDKNLMHFPPPPPISRICRNLSLVSIMALTAIS